MLKIRTYISTVLMYVRTEPWPPYNWQRRARATGGAVAVPLVCLM